MIRKYTDQELAQFVSTYYQMDPQQDVLIADGTELREGMIVLIEFCGARTGIHADMAESSYWLALQTNRWCEVSKLKVTDDAVHFVGKYEDGTERKWVMPIHNAWIARKISVKVEDQ